MRNVTCGWRHFSSQRVVFPSCSQLSSCASSSTSCSPARCQRAGSACAPPPAWLLREFSSSGFFQHLLEVCWAGVGVRYWAGLELSYKKKFLHLSWSVSILSFFGSKFLGNWDIVMLSRKFHMQISIQQVFVEYLLCTQLLRQRVLNVWGRRKLHSHVKRFVICNLLFIFPCTSQGPVEAYRQTMQCEFSAKSHSRLGVITEGFVEKARLKLRPKGVTQYL